MNFGKFAKSKKKRLIPFFQLPEAQRKLFRSLKDRDSNLFPNSTPPPSPENSEDEEAEPSFSNSTGRNSFLPTEFEIDPSIFRGNNMSASQQSVSESILAPDPQFEEFEGNNEGTFLRDDSDRTNLNDTNHINLVPPPPIPPILGNRRSSIGLDGRPRSSSSSQPQKIFVSNQKAYRLTGDKPISHSHVLRFQAQLDQNDFEQRLEDLVDKSVIKTVVIAAKAKLDPVLDRIKRQHLDDLKNHFVDPSCTKPLNIEVWNNDTFIKLL
jgi:hypothetical protein